MCLRCSIGAPSLSVLCFYGLCHDAMPIPVLKIFEKLKQTTRPLSDENVSVKDVHDLQCKISTDPKTDLHDEDDNLLTAVLIAFLAELRESLLLPTTATEFIISAGQFASILCAHTVQFR